MRRRADGGLNALHLQVKRELTRAHLRDAIPPSVCWEAVTDLPGIDEPVSLSE
jgi:hypothetical protein